VSSVDPDAFLVHTQINVSTPGEVLVFWYSSSSPKSGKMRATAAKGKHGAAARSWHGNVWVLP
jgi:hypothetical protein